MGSGLGLVSDKTHRVLSSLVVCFAGVSHGAMLSWPAEVLPQLTDPWSSLGWLDPGTLTWIASVNFIGCMLGSLASSPMQRLISVRPLLAITSCLVTLAWLMVALSPSSLTLCLSRILLGSGNALLMATVPSYICSVAPPSVRGSILNCYGIAIGLGLIYSVAIGIQMTWKSLSLLAGIPSLLLFLSSPLLASPSTSPLPPCPSSPPPPTVPRPLLLLSFLAAMYMFSGVVPLGAYAEFLFTDQRTFSAPDLVLASLVCQTVGGLLGAGMIDRQGRKPVLQAGAGVTLLANILLSLFFSTLDSNRQCPTHPGSVLCWTPAFATCLFFFGFGCGLGNIFFVLVGELVPPHRASTVIPLVTFFLNFLQFGMMKSYLLLDSILGTTFMFFLQAGMNLIFLVGQAAWIPETKPQPEGGAATVTRYGSIGRPIGEAVNMFNISIERVDGRRNTQVKVIFKTKLFLNTCKEQ